ncbi:LADA_0A07866g1_1 [Lachancea dasiensis]|uniref:LADA_0A07866g1_1 n=1 Tax=Lachancea dasiensis TaxID=1072105 RepID=A0A1G4IQ56_9SACH|nr:LADA_0A07866g1_1 [Lachancea dasiensis]
MLGEVMGLFRAQSQESVIKQYTHDLTSITSKIHQLDQSLKKKDSSKAKWLRRWYLQGTSFLVLLNAALYVRLADKHLIFASIIVSVLMLVAMKWGTEKWYAFFTQRTLRRMDQLRADHQEKLEALKRKTHFYSTNSLIQRFSSGEHQAEDAVTLMDEEMKTKYEELNKLRDELSTFQKQGNSPESQVQRDKWFDKVLDVISGGDVNTEPQMKPVVCNKCQKHTGSYTVPGLPLQYVCPLCNWRFNSDEDTRPETREKMGEENPAVLPASPKDKVRITTEES